MGDGFLQRQQCLRAVRQFLQHVTARNRLGIDQRIALSRAQRIAQFRKIVPVLNDEFSPVRRMEHIAEAAPHANAFQREMRIDDFGTRPSLRRLPLINGDGETPDENKDHHEKRNSVFGANRLPELSDLAVSLDDVSVRAALRRPLRQCACSVLFRAHSKLLRFWTMQRYSNYSKSPEHS